MAAQATAAAQRSLFHMQARAQASMAKASALALLAAEYGARLALLTAQGSDDIAVKIEALLREQRAAERALSAKLAAEDKARRAAMKAVLRPGAKISAAFLSAAQEMTGTGSDDGPSRPRERRRSTASRGPLR